MDILSEIAARRRETVRQSGYSFGTNVPSERVHPLVPFGRERFVICEIKRRSPSRKSIDPDLDPVRQAGFYAAAGIDHISVLTEGSYFGGSLEDLMAVKKAFPHCAVLRKDFLTTPEDIDISYRAGADAVLLIAALLAESELAALHAFARKKGLQVLFEVHDENDLAKAAVVKPELTGINTRDLRTFIIDPLVPARLGAGITWPTSVVYESGIKSREDALLAASLGCRGLLVGEAVVRSPALAAEIRAAFALPPSSRFWKDLFSRSRKRPFVKICGITDHDALYRSEKAGADLAGFILAPSVRQVTPQFVSSLPMTGLLKVGVVVAGADGNVPETAAGLLARGDLDALQVHRKAAGPSGCEPACFDAYSIGSIDDVRNVAESGSPRVLIDAFVEGKHGGTGRRVDETLVLASMRCKPLWLAGGLSTDNIAGIMTRFRPELVDVSSGLEKTPGKKDPERISEYIRIIRSMEEVPV